MQADPFQVVRDFEAALAEYCGAAHAVTTTSCTMALLLACAYYKVGEVEIPKYTYVGVAQSILNAGGTVKFRDDDWEGLYQLKPYPIYDSARWISGNMYPPYAGAMVCLSFHWAKQLGVQQGGCILTSDADAAAMLRRMRFDGRTEGVEPAKDEFVRGYHAYMSPEVAALGLMRLRHLPQYNYPLAKDPYPDLSRVAIFSGKTPA